MKHAKTKCCWLTCFIYLVIYIVPIVPGAGLRKTASDFSDNEK